MVFDQIGKFYAVYKLNNDYAHKVFMGILRFAIVRNNGAAFGLMAKKPILLKFISSLLIVLLLAYLTYNTFNCGPAGETLSLSFIAGGALGNFTDRIRQNYVVDFVSLNIKSGRFPFFNFADIFIFFGFILLFVYL